MKTPSPFDEVAHIVHPSCLGVGSTGVLGQLGQPSAGIYRTLKSSIFKNSLSHMGRKSFNAAGLAPSAAKDIIVSRVPYSQLIVSLGQIEKVPDAPSVLVV